MVIRRIIEIDYGHTLPNHFSFCNQIHGHRGKIVAYFFGEVNNKPGDSGEGMVMDFSICKKAMMDTIHATLDHGFAIWEKDTEEIKIDQMVSISTLNFIEARNTKVLVTAEPPTAEYLAKWAFGRLVVYLNNISSEVFVEKVEWWETPNNCAEYTAENFLNNKSNIDAKAKYS